MCIRDRDIDLLVEICSQYTMRSEFAAIHPYVSRLRRAGAAHDDERALMYADLFSGQSYLLAEGSDSTRIYLDRALIRGRQCEDPVALCRIYNALGIYAVSIETNYFGGIEYFLEAMEYARSASLNRFYLVAQCNLANTYYMRNDPAGLKYAEEVCRLGTEWGYDYLAFGGAVISAYMHYMLGDQDRALEYILRTLPDTDKFGYHTELYSLYANILHAQGDDAGAERYYLMALDHIDEKVVTAAVMTYLSYGTYLNDRGEYARAIPVLRQGIELSERSNNAVHRYKLYQRISEAETALGRYREALDYFKSYHSQADSIFNVERERSINELRVKYDAERQENMLRKSEIDLIRQQRRFQLLLLLLLALIALVLAVILRRRRVILHRRRDFDSDDCAHGTAALFAYAMELMWRGGLKRENRSLLTESAAVSAWADETVDMEALAWLNAEARYSAHPITETQRQTMRQFAADTLRRFRQKLKPWQRFYQKWFRCMY